jgi:hypothetical protein
MAQQAPKIKIETSTGPDRSRLRSELISLYHQYITDAERAIEIQREGEELIKDAKREKRAAEGRMAKLQKLLDEEFPGWHTAFSDEVDD